MSDDLDRTIASMDDEDPTRTATGVFDGVASGPSAVDLARYAEALVAADDPELILGPATDAFRDMYDLVRAGDRLAANGAGLAVQDLCLQLCASQAASAAAADDRARFLSIVIGWAWPRTPAVGAVLEASRAQELRRWGWPSGDS